MADTVYVIRNQLQQFWARSSEWVDGREPQRLLRLKHRDEAVNQLVELSARDIDLRGEVVACELNERGEPRVEASEHLTATLSEIAAKKAADKAREQEHQGSDDASVCGDETGEPGLTNAV
jgi:hypothetical protein